jgi:MFS family permease
LNIPLSIVNAAGSLYACVIIDRTGRRYLMLRSLPFAAFFWLVVATGMYLKGYTEAQTAGLYTAFVGIVFYLISFSIGMSSTPWTVNTEVYPIHVIGSGVSLSTFTNWFSNFLVATFFPLLLDSGDLGSVLAFVILALMAVLAWFFIYALLPETANKEILEILTEILGPSYANK